MLSSFKTKSGSNNGDEEKLEQEHANVDVVCPREVAP